MNIASSHMAVRPKLVDNQQPQPQQPQQPQQPPAQEPSDKVFFDSFSGALETVVPMYTAVAGAGMGLAGGAFAGALLGALATGGPGGAALGTFVGMAGGLFGGGYAGYNLGSMAMEASGDMGAAHNSANPAKGRAVGQAIAGGAITLFTGSPVATALIVGGSALYASSQAAN